MEYYKNINERSPNTYYVPNKYKHLKEELISNGINIKEFEMEYEKSFLKFNTDYAKKIYADIYQYDNDNLKKHYSHTCHYGLYSSSQLSLNHLICVMIYCNYHVKCIYILYYICYIIYILYFIDE